MSFQRSHGYKLSWLHFPLSSSLLFLYIVLPTSFFAQLAARAAQTDDSLSLTLPTLSPKSSASDSRSVNSTAGAISDPDVDTSGSGSSTPAFNYYFVILAAIAVLTCICLLLYNRRRKRKAAILRARGQHALARDVVGFAPWRGHFRLGNSQNEGFSTHHNEGLDERGEAPPAYFSGDKPPSIQETVTAVSSFGDPSRRGETLELGPVGVRSGAQHPPDYNEADVKGSRLEISRPQDVVPAPSRPVSIRSVLSHSETSAHQRA